MSKISTIYDGIVTRLDTLFPDHRRISNPYFPDENSTPALRKGYGLQIGSISNPQEVLSCQLSIDRDMIITLSREFRAREFQLTKKEDTFKDLLEDQFLILKDFEGDPTLGLSGVLTNILFVSGSSIERVFDDKDNFVKLDTTFSIKYFEDLT